MKKKCFIFIICLALFAVSYRKVSAAEIAGSSAVLQSGSQISGLDLRIRQLEKFLSFYNSPLVPYADVFIKTADKYAIDWKLVPAIAGVESTFGKRIPYNSYNAFGWGNGEIRFNSWEEAIETVTRTLKEKYYDRGLTTPYKIAPVYCPPSQVWGRNVDFFMKKIEKFGKEVEIESLPLLI